MGTLAALEVRGAGHRGQRVVEAGEACTPAVLAVADSAVVGLGVVDFVAAGGDGEITWK